MIRRRGKAYRPGGQREVAPPPPSRKHPSTVNPIPTEPSADLRAAASIWYQAFIAMTDQGFTERQAMTIIGEIIQAAFSANGDNP